MTQQAQAKALQIAAMLESRRYVWADEAAAELRRLHARGQELEAQQAVLSLNRENPGLTPPTQERKPSTDAEIFVSMEARHYGPLDTKRLDFMAGWREGERVHEIGGANV